MSLSLGVIGLVLFAALLHASWNALVKTDTDRLAAMGMMCASGGVVGVVLVPFTTWPTAQAWPYLIGSVIVHHGYYFGLIMAYRHGDLAQVYPIARGLGPFLVAMLSLPLIGEALGSGQMFGVALVSTGLISLAFAANAKGRPVHWHPLLFAGFTGLTIAAYTFLDGLGARAAATPLSYIAWLNLLEGPWLPLAAVYMRGRGVTGYLRQHWWRGALAGLISALAYAIVMWAMTLGAIAAVAALRETSVIFAALIGSLVLREPFGFKRVVAAALVAAGVILIHAAV
jgi:drug/metabolite transporter (DMT)-like permease